MNSSDGASSGLTQQLEVTEVEWRAEGERLFGLDMKTWRFRCPLCGNVATAADFVRAGVNGDGVLEAVQECLGRYLSKTGRSICLVRSRDRGRKRLPCDYAAYGLFKFGRPVARSDGGGRAYFFPFAERAK